MKGEPGRGIVVMAASAGGVEALRALLSMLPADFPAPILVVLHVPAAGSTALPKILSRAGRLTASAASDGEELLAGHVYVAPPDTHLLAFGHRARLGRGPAMDGHRPAADALFLSAALSAGPRALAVVLSGSLHDGASGSAAVERQGGTVIIQDPDESAYPGMPLAALAATRHAKVLPLKDIAVLLDTECRDGPPESALPVDAELETQLSAFLEPGFDAALYADLE
jgi:two-component system chemotaxis response regulator CheB